MSACWQIRISPLANKQGLFGIYRNVERPVRKIRQHLMKENSELPAVTSVPPHIRPINFAGIELLLDLLYYVRSFYGDIDLEAMLVLLCVSDATMRAFMLDASQAQQVMQLPRPPDEVRGSISRRAIADKTGLPRETVRRKTLELTEKGFLIVGADDRVRISYGLADPRAWRSAEQAHRAVLRYLDRLTELGVDAHDITKSFSG